RGGYGRRNIRKEGTVRGKFRGGSSGGGVSAKAAGDFEDSRHANMVSVLHGSEPGDCDALVLDSGRSRLDKMGLIHQARWADPVAELFLALCGVLQSNAFSADSRWNFTLARSVEVVSVCGWDLDVG